MNHCQRQLWTFLAACLAAVLLIGTAFAAGDYTQAPNSGARQQPLSVVATRDVQDNPDYTGHLRIYITEKSSRWATYSGGKYNYGFLDFAYDDEITLSYLESLTDTVLWDGSGSWSDLTANNVRVIAAVFSSDGTLNYADDENPHTNPYTAYPVDAAAAADLSESWPNETNYPGFTHTVFVEEGTRTT